MEGWCHGEWLCLEPISFPSPSRRNQNQRRGRKRDPGGHYPHDASHYLGKRKVLKERRGRETPPLFTLPSFFLCILFPLSLLPLLCSEAHVLLCRPLVPFPAAPSLGSDPALLPQMSVAPCLTPTTALSTWRLPGTLGGSSRSFFRPEYGVSGHCHRPGGDGGRGRDGAMIHGPGRGQAMEEMTCGLSKHPSSSPSAFQRVSTKPRRHLHDVHPTPPTADRLPAPGPCAHQRDQDSLTRWWAPVLSSRLPSAFLAPAPWLPSLC